MTMYAITNAFDKKGQYLFRSVSVADVDRKKHTRWFFDHQKGREYVKKTFGATHYRWSTSNRPGLPIADYPSSGVAEGVYSKKAINVLRERLLTHGDLHPLIMDDESEYYLFDCWTGITTDSFVSSGVCDGGIIKSITVPTATHIPDLFVLENAARLIVDESFKELTESAGLTGMVFSPVEIIFAD